MFQTSFNTVDVRGCRADKALACVRDKIYDMSNTDSVFVVHGVGTGACCARQAARKGDFVPRQKMRHGSMWAQPALLRLQGSSGEPFTHFFAQSRRSRALSSRRRVREAAPSCGCRALISGD